MASDLRFEIERVRERDLWWKAEVCLPSWQGFQSRRGAYAARDSLDVSDGMTELVFAPEGRGVEPLQPDEIELVQWVIDRESWLSAALLEALLQEYPRLQELYGYEGDERAELMPDVRSIDDFRRLIGISSVYVHQLRNDGTPYVGFELGCTWDDEHGLGVLMHGARIVKVGGADTAFTLWIARRDAEGV